MNARLTLSLLTMVGAIALAAIPSAAAATSAAAAISAAESVSSNWSGYVVKGSTSGSRFSKVSGSWVQPAITAGTTDSYSVFWVGLGGSGGTSNALEQVGTEANDVHGKVEYYAWYELVPAGPVRLSLTVHPGDRLYAEVSVSGSSVTVAIADQTTNQWTRKTLHMASPDTSSAEWIAEAPSTCNGSGSCRPLALANFGSIRFLDARATANGHTGSISDSAWTMEAVRLSESVSTEATERPGFVSLRMPGGGAEPSVVSVDGSAFSVSWSGGSTPAAPSGPPTLSAAGYGRPGS
jgi:Peptidase A4 family